MQEIVAVSQKDDGDSAGPSAASLDDELHASPPVSPESPGESAESGVRASPPRLQPSTTWYGMHCVVPIDSDDLFDLDAASNVLGEILELLDNLYKKVVTLMNSG